MKEGRDSMVCERCWYEIGTGDLEQTYEPLFAGAGRLVRPIHHGVQALTAKKTRCVNVSCRPFSDLQRFVDTSS